jgi:alpha-beta hydrolase superfamily lysophospholipase
VRQPTLLVSGREDRIVSPEETAAAATDLPQGHFLMLPRCGHAPQVEKPWLINRLVVHFLTHPRPSLPPRLTRWLLDRSEKEAPSPEQLIVEHQAEPVP